MGDANQCHEDQKFLGVGGLLPEICGGIFKFSLTTYGTYQKGEEVRVDGKMRKEFLGAERLTHNCTDFHFPY